jgi:DNA-3-methyladenine glycosylase I
VRNKLKIHATITNARSFLKIQEEFGSFNAYIWKFVDGVPIKNTVTSAKDIPANTALSDAISKDLKKRGFKFVGSTVVYAHMQATGMVNDHEIKCFRYHEV